MSGFNGRWKMIDHKNLEPYHNHIKTPEAYKERLKKIILASMANADSYIEEFKVDLPGKTVIRTVYIDGEKQREVKTPIGTETEVKAADGRTFKGTLTFEGDTKFRFLQKGEDYEAVLIYELKGDTLEVSLTAGGHTGTQTYTRG